MTALATSREADRTASLSSPAYPFRHSGPAIVCGFAETVFLDLEAASRLRPGAPVIVVNKACEHIPAFAIFSQHVGSDKLGRWATAQRRINPDVVVHAPGTASKYEDNKKRYGYVDYFWEDAKGCGTSVWAAVKLAKCLGFDDIIICGMTLERGGYADRTMARDFRSGEVLKIYRNYIKADTAWHAGVKAMSGWPAKFFGRPV